MDFFAVRGSAESCHRPLKSTPDEQEVGQHENQADQGACKNIMEQSTCEGLWWGRYRIEIGLRRRWRQRG